MNRETSFNRQGGTSGVPIPNGLLIRDEVVVAWNAAHIGVPPAFRLSRHKRKDGSERQHIHAILVFDEPVCGSVLIGAGRFREYGVYRPPDATDSTPSWSEE